MTQAVLERRFKPAFSGGDHGPLERQLDDGIREVLESLLQQPPESKDPGEESELREQLREAIENARPEPEPELGPEADTQREGQAGQEDAARQEFGERGAGEPDDEQQDGDFDGEPNGETGAEQDETWQGEAGDEVAGLPGEGQPGVDAFGQAVAQAVELCVADAIQGELADFNARVAGCELAPADGEPIGVAIAGVLGESCTEFGDRGHDSYETEAARVLVNCKGQKVESILTNRQACLLLGKAKKRFARSLEAQYRAHRALSVEQLWYAHLFAMEVAYPDYRPQYL